MLIDAAATETMLPLLISPPVCTPAIRSDHRSASPQVVLMMIILGDIALCPYLSLQFYAVPQLFCSGVS